MSCVLSEVSWDWNELRIFFPFFCKSVHREALDGIWHCLTFHIFIKLWPHRGLGKETGCWDKEWVGICLLTRYSVTKCISFIITFSTLLIEKLGNDDTQIVFQKILWTYWLLRNICVAKWDVLLLRGCLAQLVSTQIQGKWMGRKICPPLNGLRCGTESCTQNMIL